MPPRGPMMAGDAQADALWVLSDLHLAPPGEQCVFRAHEKLVALLDHVAGCAPAQMLVLNGDVFDFLQMRGKAAEVGGRGAGYFADHFQAAHDGGFGALLFSGDGFGAQFVHAVHAENCDE